MAGWLGQNLVMLDRFRLFSRNFYFSFEAVTISTFILFSALLFSKVRRKELSLRKEIGYSICVLSPILIKLLFIIFRPDMNVHYFGDGDSPIYAMGLGNVQMGFILNPFFNFLVMHLLSFKFLLFYYFSCIVFVLKTIEF